MTALALTGPVLTGEDEVLDRAWVIGGRITYERPRHSDVTRVDGWVIPGLVDMHCHLGIGPAGPVDIDQARKHAQMERDSGVLAVRDTGSATALADLLGDPTLPRIVPSGRFIARPKRYLKGYAVEVEPDGLAAEVSRQAAGPGSWVKIIADWIDRDLGAQADLAPLFDAHHLADAVAAAHALGSRVTAHAFATESIDALLDAGIDSIEHGTGMTAAHMERAARAGVPVIPTLRQIANFEAFAAQARGKYDSFASRMQHMFERRYRHVGELHDAGVTLLLGTDAGTTIAHGDLALEAQQMALAMPAADVLAAATWKARRFLGLPVLEEGASADLVVLPADPRHDIGVLAQPTTVVLKGQCYV